LPKSRLAALVRTTCFGRGRAAKLRCATAFAADGGLGTGARGAAAAPRTAGRGGRPGGSGGPWFCGRARSVRAGSGRWTSSGRFGMAIGSISTASTRRSSATRRSSMALIAWRVPSTDSRRVMLLNRSIIEFATTINTTAPNVALMKLMASRRRRTGAALPDAPARAGAGHSSERQHRLVEGGRIPEG